MKRSNIKLVLQDKIILCSFLLVCLFTIDVHAQYRWTPTIGGTGFLYKIGTNENLIGICGDPSWPSLPTTPTTPAANLHIWTKNSNITMTPLFLLQITEPGSLKAIGYFAALGIKDGVRYGIYESGLNLSNYFGSRVGIGHDPDIEYMLDVNGKIALNSNINFLGEAGILFYSSQGFDFTYKTSPSGFQSNPMTIFPSRVKISDTLECNSFLLHTNAGINRVLVSNENGNGIWTDASAFNDKDWLEPKKGKIVEPPGPPALATTLYVNPQYKKVGIGTDKPQSELAVNGKVTAKEFEATLDGFPDYVFNADY